ncbi:hypothetical protein CBM2586_B130596 [Cupriavidus phytorum]|uniref:Uncharacterized protein n=1 Tax=Cupriavidus taiwanensis TaxID=164546 RepID=A0A975XIF9_9BURK|nr:hypothetical protein CBM2586_B130596 [Cupriavidus taiwanensis]
MVSIVCEPFSTVKVRFRVTLDALLGLAAKGCHLPLWQ